MANMIEYRTDQEVSFFHMLSVESIKTSAVHCEAQGRLAEGSNYGLPVSRKASPYDIAAKRLRLG